MAEEKTLSNYLDITKLTPEEIHELAQREFDKTKIIQRELPESTYELTEVDGELVFKGTQTGALATTDVYISQGNITRQLPKTNEGACYLDTQKTCGFHFRLIDESFNGIDSSLTHYDLAVLEAVYSLLDEKRKSVTLNQIYRKMTGNKDSNPKEETVNKIAVSMQKLTTTSIDITRIGITNNDPRALVKRTLNVIQKQGVIDKLINAKTGYCEYNGTKIITYAFLASAQYDPDSGVARAVFDPILKQLEQTLGHYEKVSEDLLAIKEIDDNHEEKSIRMTPQRVAIRRYVLHTCLTTNRYKNKIYSLKYPYDIVFKECGLDEKDSNIHRYKKFLLTCLEFYKHKGLIAGWNEYGVKGKKKKVGFEIIPKASNDSTLVPLP